MKISIIIPVYNVAQYIEECLNSVIAQTYTGDLECLIVDDCGIDDSIAIAERIIQGYQGNIEFQVLHHEHNRGLSAARNTGIMASTGDYVYFLDSDDSINPKCMELMANVLETYPKSEIVQAGAVVTEKVFEWLNIEIKDLPIYSDDRVWIKSTMLESLVIPVTAWNKLIKKEFIIKNKLFFKEGVIHEDQHWNFFACKYINFLAICKHNIYNYRVRSNSIMTGDQESSFNSWLVITHDFIQNIDDSCKHQQITMIFRKLHQIYVFPLSKSHKIQAKQLLKQLAKTSTLIGKITIWGMLYTPAAINKKHCFYNRLIEKRMLKFL